MDSPEAPDCHKGASASSASSIPSKVTDRDPSIVLDPKTYSPTAGSLESAAIVKESGRDGAPFRRIPSGCEQDSQQQVPNRVPNDRVPNRVPNKVPNTVPNRVPSRVPNTGSQQGCHPPLLHNPPFLTIPPLLTPLLNNNSPPTKQNPPPLPWAFAFTFGPYLLFPGQASPPPQCNNPPSSQPPCKQQPPPHLTTPPTPLTGRSVPKNLNQIPTHVPSGPASAPDRSPQALWLGRPPSKAPGVSIATCSCR